MIERGERKRDLGLIGLIRNGPCHGLYGPNDALEWLLRMKFNNQFGNNRERERGPRTNRDRSRMVNPKLSIFLLNLWCFLSLYIAIESPQYAVVHSESDFEIRFYRKSTWISAPVQNPSFEKATKNGFHR